MMKYIFTLGLSIVSLGLIAQNSYFQQKVEYNIEVELDDVNHFIQGKVEINYTNNSLNSLDTIYMHLWGNAYKSDKSAFAKQMVYKANRTFHFSTPEERGGYKGLDFSLDGKKCTWAFMKNDPDIAFLVLENKLSPGSSLRISTPFTLKIPKVFSRLGHKGQAYAMTQWYPKPAVYDNKGWHPIPYLNQGEFFSEFGDFNVQITLPANYIIGATGVQQNPDEIKFLNDRIQLTKSSLEDWEKRTKLDSLPSDKNKKVSHFIANNVHDFAWFADKSFYVVTDTAVLKNGKKVPCFGYFSGAEYKAWQKSAVYIKQAVEYLSGRVGNYPWPHASGVGAELEAGGGMEYPMITNISKGMNAKGLDNVLEHEVGHNWFYGILGTNERRYPWMDEGINSYYEEDYMALYYPDTIKVKKKNALAFLIEVEPAISNFLSLRKLDQGVGLHSADYANVNYGLGVYKTTARYFKLLEKQLGTEILDQGMKQYFIKWGFKHPYPEDLRKVLEESSGENLAWLFEDLIKENKRVDYEIEKSKPNEIALENETGVAAPIGLRLTKKDSSHQDMWVKGTNESKNVPLDLTEIRKIQIDPKGIMADNNTCNNFLRTKGLFRTGALPGVRLLGIANNPGRFSLNLAPAVGWNAYNRWMIGAIVYSDLLPGTKFRYYFMPRFSLYETNNLYLSGQGKVEQNFYLTNGIQRLAIGAFAKSYYKEKNLGSGDPSYKKLSPYIRMELNRLGNWRHMVTLSGNYIWPKYTEPIFGDPNELTKSHLTSIYLIDYMVKCYNAVQPTIFGIRLEQQSYNALGQDENYVKATFDWRTKFYFAEKKSFDVRLFAGGFLQNSRKKSGSTNTAELARGSLSLASTGADDYLFEGPYLGRDRTDGLFSRQVDISDGGFKFPLGDRFGQFGYTNSFLTAINIKTHLPIDLPLNFPLKPYFDGGFFDDQRPINSSNKWSDALVWNGGFMLDFWNVFEIYFPIVSSKNLTDQYKQSVGTKYWNRITFSVQIPLADPIEFMHMNM